MDHNWLGQTNLFSQQQQHNPRETLQKEVNDFRMSLFQMLYLLITNR